MTRAVEKIQEFAGLVAWRCPDCMQQHAELYEQCKTADWWCGCDAIVHIDPKALEQWSLLHYHKAARGTDRQTARFAALMDVVNGPTPEER